LTDKDAFDKVIETD
jgi:hypothetical protein